MSNYKYLGYGVTDSNGVAHLDHDANGDAIEHSYTGVGAGEIDVVASLDNPIASGSIVSETYSILDTLFYDGAVEGNHREDATATDLTVRYESDGTILLNEQSSNKKFVFNHSTIDNTVFEFDVIRLNGVPRFYCRNDWYMTTTRFPSTTDWVHVKYMIENGNITVLLDGVVNYTGTINTNPGLAFILPSNASLKFKDFKIYQI